MSDTTIATATRMPTWKNHIRTYRQVPRHEPAAPSPASTSTENMAPMHNVITR